ncbi:MAG: T9SS type A sorting domain-containing protein [Bacteroidia bacterium]|nr:T9SS type A sorting domain-containing protein [Bacteroidia bacterium]
MAVLDHGPFEAWDETRVTSPSVIFDEIEERYKMWYAGFDMYTYMIGYAYEPGVGLFDKNSTESIHLIGSPNPFTKDVTIAYQIQEKTSIKLGVYNLQGVLVASLVDEVRPQGEYSVSFDGSSLPAGVYFCVLKTGQTVATRKLVKVE